MVYKRDSVTGDAIPGRLFQLRYLGGETSGSGGTVIGTYQTSPERFLHGHWAESRLLHLWSWRATAAMSSTVPPSPSISPAGQDIVTLYFSNVPRGAVLVKKVSAADNSPALRCGVLGDKIDGSVVGDANGKFVTDSTGTFLVEGVEPGTTLVIKEIRAKDGYLLDDTPQTVQVKRARPSPWSSATSLWEISSSTSCPVRTRPRWRGAVQDHLCGRLLPPRRGGKLSSNGLYWTNAEGQIILSGITGTVVVTEVRASPDILSTRTHRVRPW